MIINISDFAKNSNKSLLTGGRVALFLLVLLAQALSRPHPLAAQVPVPPAGELGIIEKSLEQSQPKFQPPPEQKIPDITIDDGRKVIDAGAGPTFLIRRIKIEGNTVIDNAALAPLVDVGKEGTPMTLGILSLYAHEVTTFYNTQGYFLARAHIPPQKIKDGVVTMKIVEGAIGEIRVVGNQDIDSADLIGRMGPVKTEKVLREETLLRPLLELNDVPGLEVKSVLKPGKVYGTSDLVLKVKESRTYFFALDVDNFGSSFTGRIRSGVTASVGSLLTFDDQFSVRGVKSEGDQNFVQSSYRFPLNHSGTTFEVAGTYSDYLLGKNLTPLDAMGTTWLLSFELAQALHRTRTAQWGLSLGVDYRLYENEQLGFVTSEDELVDVFVGFGGNFNDDYLGRTFVDLKITKGGKKTPPGRDLKSRIGGNGDVFISNFSVIRYQSTRVLRSYFTMLFSGQLATSRVLSPDQFVIGGIGTVRGYPLAEISQDSGYAATLEYVLPFPWKWSVGFGKTLDKMMTLVGFIDHGRVYVRNPQIGEGDQDLTGAGGGVRINVPRSSPAWPILSFAFMYGVPVGDPAPSERSNGFAYLSGRISY